jgi:hypothetical protein
VLPFEELSIDAQYTAASMALSTVPPLLPRAGLVVPDEVPELLAAIFDPALWNAGEEISVRDILDVLEPIRERVLG